MGYRECVSALVFFLALDLRVLGCTEGTVSLSNGGTTGIVQICRRGTMGGICSSDWGADEARVVCRELGYQYIFQFPNNRPASLEVNYRSAECGGTEQHLQDCSLTRGRRGDRNCLFVASVICQESTTTATPPTTATTATTAPPATTDPPATVVQLEQRYVINEGDPDSPLCVSVSGTFDTEVVLQFQVSDGTASEGTDFRVNETHSLQPGASEFCLPVLLDYDDSIPEDTETVTLAVSSTTANVEINPTSITVEIVDDDVLLVEPALISHTVAEGGRIRVCAVANSDFERTGVQVSLSSESGSTGDSDFTMTRGVGPLAVPGPRTLECVTITAVDDNVPEVDEYLTVSLSTTDPLVNIQQDLVTVTITDNDPVTLSVQEKVYTMIEGQFVTVCLTIPSNELPKTLVQLSASPSGGNATANDYSIMKADNFGLGATSTDLTIDIYATDNNETEGTRILEITFNLSSEDSQLTFDGQPTVEIVILDNDAQAYFTSSSYSISEGTPNASLTVCIAVEGMLEKGTSSLVRVYTVSDSALGSVDYREANFTEDLGMFAPNPACVQLTILDDEEPEPEEQFYVCIESLSPLITASEDCAVVHIIDDETPRIDWSESEYVVTEGQGSLEVCMELVGTLNDPAQVTLSTMDYSAVGTYDYVPEMHTITFGPSHDRTQCKSIEIMNDGIVEGNETFWAALTTSNPSLDMPGYVQVIIQDNPTTDGGATCEEDSIQLTNGDSAEYSLVEMCRNSRWAAICDNEWTTEDMNVVCVEATNTTAIGHRIRESFLTATEVPKCTGNEASLTQCFVVVPDNASCQYLEVQCAHTKSSGSTKNTFPVVGVVVGVVFALLLAAVILGAGLLVGAVVWRRRKGRSVKPLDNSKQNMQDLDNPVYGSVEGGTRTCRTQTENTGNGYIGMYSLPTHSVTPPLCNDLPGRESQVMAHEYEGVGVVYSQCGNVYEVPSDAVTDPADYSVLERGQDYATLEPYIGGTSPSPYEIARGDYSHLQH